jgi:alpha-2-macroglobulin
VRRLDVRDASGAPVSGGEVAVVVVDESVLALTSYELADPVSTFYPKRPDDVDDLRMRANLWESSITVTAVKGYAGGSVNALKTTLQVGLAGLYPAPPPMMAAEAPMDVASSGPVRIRNNFNALAVFAPAVPTDKTGARK